MRVYGVLLFGVMGLVPICGGCDEGAMSGTTGVGGECASSTSGALGGSGGSPPMCDSPKQVRLLDDVAITGIEIEVRYDSLDRREPRITDMELPTTELAPGDIVEVDPIDQVYAETVLVKSVDVIQDVNTSKYHRTFAGTFTKPHIMNAPGTTPIADGCPAFVMPIQDVCDNHGQTIEVQSSCWNRVCMYGEWVLGMKPELSACGYTLDGITYMKGRCNYEGGCLP